MVRSGLLGGPTTLYQLDAEEIANGGYVTTSDYFWKVDKNNNANCACGKKALYAIQTVLVGVNRNNLYGMEFVLYCEDHFYKDKDKN